MGVENTIADFNLFVALKKELDNKYEYSSQMMTPHWKLEDPLNGYRVVTFNKWWKPLTQLDNIKTIISSDDVLKMNGYKDTTIKSLGKRLEKMTVGECEDTNTLTSKKTFVTRKNMNVEELLTATKTVSKNGMEDELLKRTTTSSFKKADRSSSKKTACDNLDDTLSVDGLLNMRSDTESAYSKNHK